MSRSDGVVANMKNCRGDHWSPVKDIQSKEKNMDKVNILGVHVDMVNISQATDCIMRFWTKISFMRYTRLIRK